MGTFFGVPLPVGALFHLESGFILDRASGRVWHDCRQIEASLPSRPAANRTRT